MANVKLLASMYSTTLAADLRNADNSANLARAGDRIVFVPMTHWRAVMCGDVSLEDLWPGLVKTSSQTLAAAAQTQARANIGAAAATTLAAMQTELIRWTDRLTQLELWAAQQGYVIPAEEEEA